MFKNATVYKIKEDFQPTTADEEDLQKNSFVPCLPSQAESIGWVPPRGEPNGPLIERVGDDFILKLRTEVKRVPAEVIERMLTERAAQIESTTGRKPGKKERRELKGDLLQELLPRAFPTTSTTLVWLDAKAQRVVVDSATQSRSDAVATQLCKDLLGLILQAVQTKVSPTALMTEWLVTQEPAEHFTVDRECELEAADESRAAVKYARHPLDTEEVRHCVETGKLPKALAMTYDGKVSFVLTDAGFLKKLEFLDVVLDESVDEFDASVALATGTLGALIPALIETLGGEVSPETEA